jgi:hypothetical protein
VTDFLPTAHSRPISQEEPEEEFFEEDDTDDQVQM